MTQTEAGTTRRVVRQLSPAERSLIAPELQAIADARARDAAARSTLARMIQLLTGRADVVLDGETGEIFEAAPASTQQPPAAIEYVPCAAEPVEIEVPDHLLGA